MRNICLYPSRSTQRTPWIFAKNIIKATAKTFQPKLFIVDKEPLGLKKEVLPTLKWLKRSLPGAKAILGLRDIMDDAATTRSDWDNKGVYQAMEELYSEVWVYGLQDFYDPVQEYGIPQSIAKKMTFTGYIPRRVPDKKSVRKIKVKNGFKRGRQTGRGHGRRRR